MGEPSGRPEAVAGLERDFELDLEVLFVEVVVFVVEVAIPLVVEAPVFIVVVFVVIVFVVLGDEDRGAELGRRYGGGSR